MAQHRVFAEEELSHLITLLMNRGYEVIGPVLRDGAIVLERIESLRDLPKGWIDEQSPGHYRLNQRADGSFFSYVVGPQSWKKYLHPADLMLWSAQREDGVFRILNNESKPAPRYAFLGVRACDLAAIAIQDRVLLQDRYRDPNYQSRREGVFIVAVQCAHSAPTCFCASMATGPGVREGFDLALTELAANGQSRFVVTAGSTAGDEVLAELKTSAASNADEALADAAVASAAASQTRRMDTANARELLYANFDSSYWDAIADRCLSCANCTMVCPTCFCTTVEDTSDLTGDHAERWRRADSCFSLEFSHIHGGDVRTSAKSRYRQWLTHKLASWQDQFGSVGCVGCGRCITWCPVGIDITQELSVFQGGAK